MGLARTGAGHVGGVARGEIESARAVAEQVERLAREHARGLEIARLAARLEQAKRCARHRRIVVEERAGAGMALAPGMQEPPVGAAQFRKHKVERGPRGSKPFRLAEHSAGADERRDGQAVPVGQHLVVAARLRTRLAQSEQARAGGRKRASSSGEPRGVTRRSTVRPSQFPPRVTS